MNSATPDLTACDQEPIRFPGSIQPHGFLLALSPDYEVLQASANLAEHTGMAPQAALGRPLSTVLGAVTGLLEQALQARRLRSQPCYLGNVQLAGGAGYDVLAHAWDSLLILEFEPVTRGAANHYLDLYPLVGDFLQNSDAGSVGALCAFAAREIRRVAGFGRVLVYRFDDEGHGHVLAEDNDGSLPSALGQRFPAADIPRQARALYLQNRIRLIVSADYQAAPLVPVNNPLTSLPTDLSHSALRSVSPVHLQYMRNMGTLASMSVSLVVKGKLWGLISCHHATPAHLSYDRRTACEQLGQVLALRLESREDANELQFRLNVRQAMVATLASLTKGSDFIDNMRNAFPALLNFARAGGVAVVVNDRIASYGDTPDEAQIRALVQWLGPKAHDDIYHTERLAAAFAPAAAYVRYASGLLAVPISRIHQHYLLWFRPEQVYTIAWAGEPPDKAAAQDAHVPLSPRHSFASWRQTVRSASLPWHPAELEMTLEFRSALLVIALERAEQMAELAEELGRANKELEAFSYSVSHDLRAPLRHIVGFSDLLMESGDDPERRQRYLHNIKDAARLAGKLVDDLLSFSQMGRAALHPVKVDLRDLVQSCIDKLALETCERALQWEVGDLPAINADPAFLQLAVYNLLSNAVKFTAQQDPAVIRINATADEHEVVVSVADNGVGFNMAYVHKLFGVFQRLHRMEEFQGTGIGLANVRRIVERHGGRVWADSVRGEGATFSFSIPLQLPAD